MKQEKEKKLFYQAVMLKIDTRKTREELQPSRQDMILAFNIYKVTRLPNN